MRYVSLAISAMIVLGFALEVEATSMKFRCGSMGPEVLVNRAEPPDSEFVGLARGTDQFMNLPCIESVAVR